MQDSIKGGIRGQQTPKQADHEVITSVTRRSRGFLSVEACQAKTIYNPIEVPGGMSAAIYTNRDHRDQEDSRINHRSREGVLREYHEGKDEVRIQRDERRNAF
eukprot:767273-Hanusia_phi.AAC.2